MGSYIGKPIPRVEDLRFVQGQGRYTDDLALREDAVWAYVARTDRAHAKVLSIDISAAQDMPGVIAVLTAEDYLADGHHPMRHIPIPADAVDSKLPAFTASADKPIFDAPHVPLLTDRVRHVGEGIALVVARTLDEARDAAEQVMVEYEALPAVVFPLDAVSPGAPQLYDGAPGNICFDQSFGDQEATAAAFAHAHLVLEHTFVNSRIVTCQMEPRSAIARYDQETGRYYLLSGSQGAVRQRMELAQALGVPVDQIDLVCPDVGGGFGSRTTLYTEQLLVTWAAKRLGLPVRWTSDRSEAFLTDYQGRDLVTKASMALAADGRVLAVRNQLFGNVGGHTVSYVPLSNGSRVTTTVYDVPTAWVRTCAVLTNTTPTAPFRGAGRPEAHFVMERMLDMAARRLGIDRVEIRRRNLIARAKLPYRSPMGLTYDSGDFHGNFERALKMADWAGFPARRAASRAKGLLRGIGIANYVESPVGAPRERIEIRVLPDGRIEILAGTQSTGQGHETTFAQVVADLLGVDMRCIKLVTGDTRLIAVGGGSHSDRSMRLGGTLMVRAAAEIIEKARAAAALRLNCEVGDVAFEAGRLSSPAGSLSLFEAAGLSAADNEAGLSAAAEFNGRMPAHPPGRAVCELEIDPETGVTRIQRYTSIDDVGQPINPLIVDGQVHGGIAQGVGQALTEDFIVDRASGQVLGGSFMDYGVPRADFFPRFDIALTEDPTGGNPLRVKGGGESGITPATATIINAVVDALAEFGIEHVDMPATPQRLWRAIREAKAKQAKHDRE